jgi:hypothetical protein
VPQLRLRCGHPDLSFCGGLPHVRTAPVDAGRELCEARSFAVKNPASTQWGIPASAQYRKKCASGPYPLCHVAGSRCRTTAPFSWSLAAILFAGEQTDPTPTRTLQRVGWPCTRRSMVTGLTERAIHRSAPGTRLHASSALVQGRERRSSAARRGAAGNSSSGWSAEPIVTPVGRREDSRH